MDKNGRKHFQVCYLHEDSVSLICFIEHDSKFVVVLDVKNMDLTDDDQMLEARNPLLSTQPCKPEIKDRPLPARDRLVDRTDLFRGR